MRTFASPLKNKATLTKSSGEVAEWSIAAVLKTVVPRGTRGSNPCLSARLIEYSPVEFILWDFFYDNQSKFLEKVVISFGGKSCI